MNVLNVQGLRKSYGSRVVFDGVSLAADAGEKIGMIGANGSGKSTLLRILAGLDPPDDGIIALRRGTQVGYLAQEPEFRAGASVRDAAAGGREWDHRAEEILTRLQVRDWDRPVALASGGEQKRIALARVLLAEPDLLLLDEPTNHLDTETVEWLEDRLAAFSGALLLVTHDRYFLDRVVGRMLEVTRGALHPFPGGYTAYLAARAEREAIAASADQKRRRMIEQELAWARRAPSARTGKQQARLDRLDSLRAEEQSERSSVPAGVATLEAPSAPRLGRTVLNLHEVSKQFGDRVLFQPFSTIIQAGERIGIVGPNGAGKTTLLRVLIGEEAPTDGQAELGVNTRIAYFDQGRGGLDPSATVYQSAADQDWVEVGGERLHLVSYLQRFGFPPDKQRQAVRSLSGGERNRLLLARLFLQEANLLVLDEPTNDLDLETLGVLESALLDFAGSALIVSHDRYFLDRVATGLIAFEPGGVLRRHAGGYDLYRRLRAEREAAASAVPAAARRSTPAAPRAPARRKLSYREARELEGMEAAILKAEERRERLQRELAATSGTDWQEATRLTEELAAAAGQVEQLYARWAELEEVASGT